MLNSSGIEHKTLSIDLFDCRRILIARLSPLVGMNNNSEPTAYIRSNKEIVFTSNYKLLPKYTHNYRVNQNSSQCLSDFPNGFLIESVL